MANTQGVPTHNNYRLKAMRAIYLTSGLKCALYLTSATIGPTTTVYTSTGEITSANYTAGGVNVTSATQAAITSNTTYWTPSAPIVFGALTAGPFNCAMIYDPNDSNMNLFVGTFGDQTLTAGVFTLNMPTNDATNGLVRWAWS